MARKKTKRKPETPSKALATSLPGQDKVDKVLLNSLVELINTQHTSAGLNLARSLGKTLLMGLYTPEGSKDSAASLKKAAAAFQKLGRKHATCQALLKDERLEVSSTTLYYAAQIAAHWHELEQGGVDPVKLSYTHHQELVAVRDPDDKVKLAKKGLKMTKDKFRQLVANTKGKSARGRPAVPPWAKNIRSLVRQIEAASQWDIIPGDQMSERYPHYTKETAEELLGELDTHLEQLQTARKQLASQVKVIDTTAEE